MTKELDPNFKRVFSFELLLHRIENTKAECEQYSKLLLEKTVAGLVAQGKISINYNKEGTDYAISAGGDCPPELPEKLTRACNLYKKLTDDMGAARSDVTSRSWMDGKVLKTCNLIDTVILPVAMSENLLDMSVTLDDFSNMAANLNKDHEEE